MHPAAVDTSRFLARAGELHGAVRLAEAPRAGLDRDAVARFADRHAWPRPVGGVVVAPGAPATYRLLVALAVLHAAAAPPVAPREPLDLRVAVEGSTLLHLLGLQRVRPRRLNLVVPYDRAPRAFAVPRQPLFSRPPAALARSERIEVVVRRMRRFPEEIVEVEGLPALPLPVALLRLAPELRLDHLRQLVIDVRQRRLSTLDDLRAALEAHFRAPGSAALRAVVRQLDERTCDSALEEIWRDALAGRGLGPWPRPFPYTCPDGVTIEIDVAFPDQWVACECDGLSSRAQRAELAKHHRRQNQAVLGGWQPFLVDWDAATRWPERTLDALERMLEAADRRRPPAQAADPALVDPRFGGRR